jgi:uncharacterized oxidoreductase
MHAINEFRRKLDEGNVLLGASISFSDPLVSEALADSVDFLWIDSEHSPKSPEVLAAHLLAARARSKPAVVRVPSAGIPYLKGALDSGAEGIIVPQIKTIDEVRQAVDHCRYYDAGCRGYGPRVPSNYGRNAGMDYIENANRSVFVAVQIETPEALEAIDEIVAVPGLDAVVIGPADLSMGLGHPCETEHPEVIDAVKTIITKARQAGLSVGAGMGPDCGYATRMIDLGVQWLQIGDDYSHMIAHTDQVMSIVRAHADTVASTPPSEVSEQDRVMTFEHEKLRQVGTDLFVACGAPDEEARLVADELVEASLLGLDSHGAMRFSQYADDARTGKIKPSAPTRIVKETANSAIVDCGFNFGPVTAVRMVDIVCEKARDSNMATVVSHNCHHVSRLGSYTQKVAERGFFGMAFANSSKHGHFVVPWGGREGRLATNPISYAVPTSGLPVVMDMSTSMIAEGKIRVLRDKGSTIPPNAVLDAGGNPTDDPDLFYGPPMGTIRPFGSELGYKGFGLGLLVEIMGGLLAGCASSEDLPYINGFCILAINPESFCGADRFRDLVDDLSGYVTSSEPAPGSNEVVMPGTLDFRVREKRLVEGIPLPQRSWDLIVEAGQKVGVNLNLPDRK